MANETIPAEQSSMHTRCGRTIAVSRPARVASVTARLTVPALPPERAEALLAVVSHCTVHTTLNHSPELSVTLEPQR